MRNLNFRLDLGEIYLRLLEEKDVPDLLKLYVDNAAFLKPWEPVRSPNFYTPDGIGYIIKADQEASRADEAYAFGLYLTENDKLIGRFRLSWIMRGFAETCNIGYFLSEAYNGKGYSTRAVKRLVQFCFEELGLHRVAAATMLANVGSQRVLEKAGFHREGMAPGYLKMNDRWEDHYLFAILREEWEKR